MSSFKHSLRTGAILGLVAVSHYHVAALGDAKAFDPDRIQPGSAAAVTAVSTSSNTATMVVYDAVLDISREIRPADSTLELQIRVADQPDT